MVFDRETDRVENGDFVVRGLGETTINGQEEIVSEANQLTDEEHRAIRLLWDKGGASADELALAMASPAPVAPLM